MLKLRSMIEDVAERLFGQFLPQVQAGASNCEWVFTGCCGHDGNSAAGAEKCDGQFTGNTFCDGLCPQ